MWEALLSFNNTPTHWVKIPKIRFTLGDSYFNLLKGLISETSSDKTHPLYGTLELKLTRRSRDLKRVDNSVKKCE